MAFKRDILAGPAFWLGAVMVLTMASCFLYTDGREYWGIGALAVALACAGKVLDSVNRLRRRVRYLISAALHTATFHINFPPWACLSTNATSTSRSTAL